MRESENEQFESQRIKKKAEMQEEFKARDEANSKSWPDLAEEEEFKDVNIDMMMQPQDYVTQIAEAGKEAKIKKITEAYE